ncbi:DUF4369 domain-containing protein [Lutibacter sp.]|uniref:DUF4369 domain-containing protein n=1 Tax=Lutibacter sp. TaxID=1925666 RepID=UPI001A3188FB|nr:DUF4369 domain-containing protein [Lutibacter sp.]MBI9040674.1 DUF4369 domain-containing protein [Lutibacter sp.]
MKKLLSCVILVTLLFSCTSNKKGNMLVNGTIDGLKKGTVYLQKMKDTVLVSVDSVEINGDGKFILSDDVESPEIYFISLDKMQSEIISFFGEPKEISITSKVEKFATSAKITGSENQLKLDEHNEMAKKFTGKQLDLFKEKFDAQKANDTALLSKLLKEEKNLIKRKYYYTTNFAVTHSDFETAPYLALTELYNANVKLLDTINNSLTAKIKKSKYGLQLDKFIKEIKQNEN